MSALRTLLVAMALAIITSSTAAAVPARKAAAPAKKAAVPAKAPAKVSAAAGARQLDDIHIEGEIAVPQVLFITARDQRRFLDFQHHRYLRTSAAVGGATTFPSRIAVVKNPELDARKEIAP